MPPPAAVGDRWRTWLLTAIDRAFLPARGRRIDLTPHLAGDLHSRRPHCHGDATAGARPQPATPYWAALIGNHPTPAALAATDTTPPGDPAPATDPTPTGSALTDLALAGLAAADEVDGLADLAFVDLAGTVADDRLGILAGRALRGGGVLAVLTHCHHTDDSPVTDDDDHNPRTAHRNSDNAAAGQDNAGGDNDSDAVDTDGRGAARDRVRLVDPTGSVVASAQNADLLYLQHIVIPTRPLAPSAITNPAIADPGTTHPAAADPGTTHPAAADPGTMNPAAADPAATDRSKVSIETSALSLHQHLLSPHARHRIAHVDLLVFARPAGLPAVTRPVPTSLPPRTGAGAPAEELLTAGCGPSADEEMGP
jgi:hypothetical protein